MASFCDCSCAIIHHDVVILCHPLMPPIIARFVCTLLANKIPFWSSQFAASSICLGNYSTSTVQEFG
jgi:hypothetical protein